MTAEEVTNALKGAIAEKTGFPVFLLPQRAVNNTAHIDLLFRDCAQNGIRGEKLTFTAEYRTSGTHAKWLSETIRLRRTLHEVEDGYVPVEVTDRDGEEKTLRAYWTGSGDAQWVYPDTADSSMPAQYVVQWQIELDCPENIITEV